MKPRQSNGEYVIPWEMKFFSYSAFPFLVTDHVRPYTFLSVTTAAQEKKGKNEASAENSSSPVSSFTKNNDDKGHKWALKGPGDDRDERSSIRRKNSAQSNSTESKGSTA